MDGDGWIRSFEELVLWVAMIGFVLLRSLWRGWMWPAGWYKPGISEYDRHHEAKKNAVWLAFKEDIVVHC